MAPAWHTALLLIAICLIAYRSHLRADMLRTLAHPDRMRLYQLTILSEWLMLGLVLAGLWLAGSSPLTVLGERWRSAREVFRDLGIGLVFLILTIAITSIFGAHRDAADSSIQYLLPRTMSEVALWFAVSISAGICEEAVYRGYLQKQFAAMAKSVPIGIVLSGLTFGLAHSYQGFRRATMIAFMGMMAGILAYWRRSMRPGMIAHALQDMLGAFVRH